MYPLNNSGSAEILRRKGRGGSLDPEILQTFNSMVRKNETGKYLYDDCQQIKDALAALQEKHNKDVYDQAVLAAQLKEERDAARRAAVEEQLHMEQYIAPEQFQPIVEGPVAPEVADQAIRHADLATDARNQLSQIFGDN